MCGPFTFPDLDNVADEDGIFVQVYDRNGILHRLLELSAAVAARYRWYQPQALAFIAFGLAPSIQGLNELQIKTELHPIRALSRITIIVDP